MFSSFLQAEKKKENSSLQAISEHLKALCLTWGMVLNKNVPKSHKSITSLCGFAAKVLNQS